MALGVDGEESFPVLEHGRGDMSQVLTFLTVHNRLHGSFLVEVDGGNRKTCGPGFLGGQGQGEKENECHELPGSSCPTRSCMRG